MAGYDIQNLEILIVDDDSNMRHLLRNILNSLGVKSIEAAGTAELGYAKLEEFKADICICDLRMEPLDGIEFTRMVRTKEDSPNCYLPIIMLTGHAEMAAVVKARDAGVHEFMSKPVSPEKLYAKIHTIIETPRVFVRSGDYFGPDRRRRQDPKFKGSDRRKRA
ncbi:MAG: response regulator [Rhodospirillales bacterium]|nr:response regulator [Rhodospirillales bacterium]